MATVSTKSPQKAAPRRRANAPGSNNFPPIPAELVAERAYEKFAARGFHHGFDQQDWFEAEKELTIEAEENG